MYTEYTHCKYIHTHTHKVKHNIMDPNTRMTSDVHPYFFEDAIHVEMRVYFCEDAIHLTCTLILL